MVVCITNSSFPALTIVAPRGIISVTARLSMTSYETRFKDLLKRLSQQDSIFRDEIQIIHLEISMQQKAALEQVTEVKHKIQAFPAHTVTIEAKKVLEGIQNAQDRYREDLEHCIKSSESAVERLRRQAAVFVEQCSEHTRLFEKGSS